MKYEIYNSDGKANIKVHYDSMIVNSVKDSELMHQEIKKVY